MNLLYIFPLRSWPTKARTVVTTNADGTPCNFVDDLTWDYHGMLAANNGTDLMISFDHIAETIRPGIQHALHAITRDRQIGISHILNCRTTLLFIAKLLGSTDWALIDHEFNYTAFKKALRAEKLTASRIMKIQAILRTLFHKGLIQRYIAPEDCFVNKCSASTKTEQHIALPQAMASKLFATAMDIVERYHPHRHSISVGYEAYLSAMDAYEGYIENFSASVGQKISHNVPFSEFFLDGFAKCAQEIQTACWLVLIGFSGVRENEGKSMNPASYDENSSYKGKTVPLLHGKISKIEVAGKPKAESWVTHPITKLALELAYDMSNFARRRYRSKLESQSPSGKRDRLLNELSSAFLVLAVRLQRSQVIMRSTSVRLRKFAEKYDIRASEEDVIEFNALNPTRKGQLREGGLLPKLSSHDFRRSYACFLIRNRLGSLMTLRAQYKHNNIMMTAWYQNGASLAAVLDLRLDDELQQMIRAANRDIHENTLFHIFNEAETLSGFEGRRILSEREVHEAKYPGQVYISREEIRIMLRNNTISVVEHPTGYCFNPDCDRICSSDKSTETCKHEVLTPEKVRKQKLPRHQRWVRKFRALNTGRYYMKAILTDIQTEIKAIEKCLSDHKIPFEPFSDEIIAPSIGDAILL